MAAIEEPAKKPLPKKAAAKKTVAQAHESVMAETAMVEAQDPAQEPTWLTITEIDGKQGVRLVSPTGERFLLMGVMDSTIRYPGNAPPTGEFTVALPFHSFTITPGQP